MGMFGAQLQVKIHLKALNLQRLAIKSNQEVTITPSSFQLLFQILDQFLSPKLRLVGERGLALCLAIHIEKGLLGALTYIWT